MTTFDPNLFTLHISKLAALQLSHNNNNLSILLRKQCWKKVNQQTVLVHTELDLTFIELQLLSEAGKLAEYFLLASEEAAKSPPPPKPPRN